MLLELARELQVRGHDVLAVGPRGGEGWLTGRFAALGIERVLLELRGPSGLGMASPMAKLLRERRVEVLHSHEFGMAICGAVAARLADCPHVITMHGGPYYSLKVRRRLALRAACATGSRLVAVSDALRKSVADALWLRPEAVAVVYNGSAPRAGRRDATREALGIAPDQILVLAVGNLRPVKGHAFLVQALAALDGRAPVAVAIVGSGSEEPALRALAHGSGVEDRLHLLGYRSDVPDLLAAADVFVMPSLSEGMPMAMIEAMLAGKPIVASNVGGIPELIDTTEVGLLVPPRDVEALAHGLARVIHDASLREGLGEAARARALEHFSASAMAERYLELYRAG